MSDGWSGELTEAEDAVLTRVIEFMRQGMRAWWISPRLGSCSSMLPKAITMPLCG